MVSKSLLFLVLGMLAFGTSCGQATAAPDAVPVQENPEIQEESLNESESEEPEEQTVDKEQMEILTQVEGIDTSQAEYILEKLTEAIPGIRVASAEKISDDVGNGIQVADSEGKEYKIYMYQSGVIYGIKEVSTGDYLYMVYE